MSVTYLLADDDLKEIILCTQESKDVIVKGLDQFVETKHEMTVHRFNEKHEIIDKMSFEDFCVQWYKS